MVYDHLIALTKGGNIDLKPEAFTSSVNPADYFPSVEPPSNTIAGSEPRGSRPNNEPPSPQYLRAYRFWHDRKMSMEKMCKELSLKGDPLKNGTVMYVSSVVLFVIGIDRCDFPIVPISSLHSKMTSGCLLELLP